MNRSRSLIIILAALLALMAANTASAAPGHLDRTFGSNGRAVIALKELSFATSVVLQPDGRIVIGGILGDKPPRQGILIRLGASGQLDRSFGVKGVARLGPAMEVELAATSSGEIYALAREGIDAASLYSVSRDGQLLKSYGNDGKLGLGERLPNYVAENIAVQDQKLLVTGTNLESPAAATEMVLTRLLPDGAIDTSFGISGVVKRNGGFRRFGGPPVAVFDDESIIVGFGEIARLERNGVADNAFHLTGELASGKAGASFELATKPSGGFAVVARSVFWGKHGYTRTDAHHFDRFGTENVGALSEVRGTIPVRLPGDSIATVKGGAPASPRAAMLASIRTPDGSAPTDWRFAVGPESFASAAVALPSRDLLMVGETCDGGCHIAAIKALTTEQGVPAISPGLRFPKAGGYRKGKVKVNHISGVVTPAATVKRVDVAILRTATAGSTEGFCSWMEKNRRTFKKRRMTKAGNCSRPLYMRATGRTKWRLKLRRSLPVGEYEVRVRTQMRDRSFSRATHDADAFSEVTVSKRQPQ